MRQYKIGEIAKILGLTTQALRFYEQEGIIVPKKTENGTRFFSEADIIRLLAFKRFRLSDFTVQDVAKHFKQGSLQSLVEQLDVQSDALIAQSELLLRRARAIRSFERILRESQLLMNEMHCVDRPDIYMHVCTLGELDRLDESMRESFSAFMDAMPDTHICFVCDAERKGLKFHFAVSKKDADIWALPLEDTVCFPAGRCVRIYVRTDARLWDIAYLYTLSEQAAQAGYAVDWQKPIIGQQLASECEGKQGFLIAAIYIPLLPE